MYYVLDPTNAGKYVFKAQKCNNNNYGATANKAYGLTATPCKNCPVGMKSLSVLWSDADDVSRKDSNNVELAIRDGTSTGALFVHPLSCVTKAGYGECNVRRFNLLDFNEQHIASSIPKNTHIMTRSVVCSIAVVAHIIQ